MRTIPAKVSDCILCLTYWRLTVIDSTSLEHLGESGFSNGYFSDGYATEVSEGYEHVDRYQKDVKQEYGDENSDDESDGGVILNN